MQNKKLNTALLAILTILVGFGIYKMSIKDKQPETIQESVNSVSPENGTPPSTSTSSNTNITESDNANFNIYTSNALGIRLKYPKTLTFTCCKPTKTEVKNVILTENANRITVSTGDTENYYADIYHKQANESFEQSILRQIVKPEYRNNPCTVVKVSSNTYRISYPGASLSDFIEAPGPENMEKCGGEFYAGRYSFTADPNTGGFYIAKTGTQEPTFGLAETIEWWPKGIIFFK